MKTHTKKELQDQHRKHLRHIKALDIAIEELMQVAAAPSAVVHPAYSKGAMKALKRIEKLIRTGR
jgi:hypothetical protein